jgi:hypothetical protein
MKPRLASLLLCIPLSISALTANAVSLERDFENPPQESWPWTYWFWLNGNITREGITADLEAMKRVGIVGVLIMEVDQGAPVGPVDFMSPKWRELFKHVVSESRRLGIKVNMNNDAGWNGSGGPWITPELSMQKVVWSETNAVGPVRLDFALTQPETIAGYYKDIRVLAFPATGDYRLPRILQKAAFQIGAGGSPITTKLQPEQVIDKARIMDISKHMDSSGRLTWDVPEGRWTIMRFGHTSTGAENKPAPKSGKGLECDKLSPEGIEANFAGMMAKLAQDNGIKPGGRDQGLVATHIDSWENGSQNWTGKMREEFQARRGYDLIPWLPAFSGRIIESTETTERFLWDLRQTVSELVIQNYAGRMRELAHSNGMLLTIEAYGSPCDIIPYAGQCDEPMGEFWTPGGNYIDQSRSMASAAHLYGRNIVGAEAFTAGSHERWKEHPALLKALGDRAFCEGINRFVFHRYAMQPWKESRLPGMTMGPWGQHYERTQTWWDDSRAWHLYLARCQHMLRQGRFAADICYLQPEAPPHGHSSHKRGGYGWDECSAAEVLTLMSAEPGGIVLPSGMRYRVLVLPQTPHMTPRLLAKIRDLVKEGATILGEPPKRAPGLGGYPQTDAEVQALARELWGETREAQGERRFGKGVVAWGRTPEKFLSSRGVPPDFDSRDGLRFIHRTASGTDVYFVSNPNAESLNSVAAFRVIGKLPELWRPDSGQVESAAIYSVSKDVTTVSLPLRERDSVFVVFRNPLPGTARSAASVSANGKKLLTTALQAARPVEVLSATYGVPGDPQRTRDVREEVQRRVDSGEDSFQVGSLADSSDPAFNSIKTLTVQYRADGKQFSAKGQDPDMVFLTGRSRQVQIHKATYGLLNDPKKIRDVRVKLQKLFDNGGSAFQVSQMAAGDDPAYRQVKTLVFEYTVDAQRLTWSGTDRELFELAPIESSFERIVEVVPAEKPILRAWQAGDFGVNTTDGASWNASIGKLPPASTLDGHWTLTFPTGSGGPERVALESLVSWSEHADPRLKYYSGRGTYVQHFDVPREQLGRGRHLQLDLGKVEVMARVQLNGRDLGTLWKPPYEVDITKVVKPGTNELEITVVNLWPNRLIGDELLPEDSERNPNGTLKSWPEWLLEGKGSPTGRSTFTSWRLWKKDDALLPSGLIGPVRLVWSQSVEATPE